MSDLAIQVDFPPLCDGMFIKQILCPRKGALIPQHSHKWDHSTLLARGSVICWEQSAEGGPRIPQLYRAPAVIFIPKGLWHEFQIMEDNTLLYCLHNLKGADAVEVLEEHHLEEVDFE